jgi:hypothetical protein
MSILGPEAVHAVPRMAPIQLDMRSFYVETPVARQLGLHDGQVVQAMAFVRQDQVKLTLNEHIFNAPLLPYIKDGDLVQMRAVLSPTGQWSLQLLHTGSFAGATMAQAAAAPTRLNTLLFQPGGFSALLALLKPGVLESMVPPVQNADELKKRISAQRLSMASLQPQTLRRWVQARTQTGEGALLNGDVAHNDAKMLLRQLMVERKRVDHQDSHDQDDALSNALDELESSQVQAAQDQMNGDLRYTMVIPFKDADPVEMQFERHGNKPGQPKNPLVVNMHTQSRALGEVWLKTSITENSQVDLTMWALKPEVAEQARFNASELTYELENAGLVMGSFQVYNAARPDATTERPLPDHGALVDTQA